MSAKVRSYCMWCLGLDAHEVEQIRSVMGRTHHLVVLSEEVEPTPADAERDEPVLVWIGRRFWRRAKEKDTDFRFMDHLSRVLVLPADSPREELEAALSGGFQDVVYGSPTPERLHEVLRRSLEVSNIYEDMERMTRELLMNRELLMRKEDVFSFLQNFITRVAKCASTETILTSARAVLEEMLPLGAMHLAVWKQQDEGVAMQLYLDSPSTADDAENGSKVWSDLLLSTAAALAPGMGANLRITTHYSDNPDPQPQQPDSRRTLLLPLCTGGVFCGVMALFLTREFPLGRDQVMALDAAMNHLAIVLQTASRSPLAVSLVSVGEVLKMAAVPQ